MMHGQKNIKLFPSTPSVPSIPRKSGYHNKT